MNDYLVTGLLTLGGVVGYVGLVLLLARFCSVNDLGDDRDMR